MRKIEQVVCGAFVRGESASLDNSMTDGNHLYLHGNLIVERKPDGTVMATLAGWNTPTTRSRINAVAGFLGINGGVFCRGGIPHIQPDHAIEVNEWFELK